MVIRDRSAPKEDEETEITPEMIEAGAQAVRLWLRSEDDEGALQFLPSHDALAKLVVGVFRHMSGAMPFSEIKD